MPAVSQSVIVVAPALMAAFIASARNAPSLRVASSATNSTSSQRARQEATVRLIASSIASGFVWKRYSICTGLVAAQT